jgi:hypothetical protein
MRCESAGSELCGLTPKSSKVSATRSAIGGFVTGAGLVTECERALGDTSCIETALPPAV